MIYKVIGIGEVLWDLMPAGRQLGGAPANFAFHARSLGANASVITRVGEDSLGREILQRFNEMKIADGVMQIDAGKPTGTVAVTLCEDGVPQFTIHEDVAWDWLAPTEAAQSAVSEANAICFGTLAQRNTRSRSCIRQLMAAAPAGALRIFDINLRQPYYSREIIEESLQMANVLKLNDQELPVLAGMFDLGIEPRQQMERLAELFHLQVIVLTRGPRGSFLYQDGRWSERVSEPVNVVDTVGAGDAFTAALTMGLLNKLDLDQVHIFATQVAGFVCSQAGATPVLPTQLRNKFAAGGNGTSDSVIQIQHRA
ncbi:MAG TPA: carbohydrate kinase [Verrucomicrobiae bacterium]|jgi:fructokinase|nr:carbohydrate kinase [Verrucomicrobiae bacterium]